MAEAIVEGMERDEAMAVFGHRDEHLRIFRDVLGLKVVARNGSVSLQGAQEQVDLGLKILDQLRDHYRQQRDITPVEVRVLIDQMQPKPTDGRHGLPIEVVGPIRRIHTKTDGQITYVEAMRSHDLVMCEGPAGTGKTFLAVAQALEDMQNRRIKRIVLVRPAVEAGERLGFLPGDMQAKVNPYLRPLLDALRDMLDYHQVKSFLENDAIEMAPLAYMRGRTLNESFIILDEGQNTTIPQMQMFLTRMGMGSKIVVTGDTTQVDLPPGTRSGMKDAIRRLRTIPGVGICRMEKKDIVRHPLVQAIVRAYEVEPGEADGRRREGNGSPEGDGSSAVPENKQNS